MKSILKLLVVTALLSVAALAQTTIVEYTKQEPYTRPYISVGTICLADDNYRCSPPAMEEVTHLDKFDTLEAAMQFMADHQDYKLVHFYSALVAVDVKVEEKKTSEAQPPIEKTEKIYKFGSITKKKQDTLTFTNSGSITFGGSTWVVK